MKDCTQTGTQPENQTQKPLNQPKRKARLLNVNKQKSLIKTYIESYTPPLLQGTSEQETQN